MRMAQRTGVPDGSRSGVRSERGQVRFEVHLRGTGTKIQIAGPGCLNCQTTKQRVPNACAELDLAADTSHVSDLSEIAAAGVVRSPAVIIDGKIVSMGRVTSLAELKTMFRT